MSDAKLLKLVAMDDADLAVISAHLQDAVLKVEDIKWLKSEHRCVVQLRRFVWENAVARRRRTNERRLSVLHFDRVRSVKASGVRPDQKDTVLSLLAVTFAETDPPAGTVSLLFSGGATLRLSVECLEAQFTDLGAAWQTHARPKHPAA